MSKGHLLSQQQNLSMKYLPVAKSCAPDTSTATASVPDPRGSPTSVFVRHLRSNIGNTFDSQATRNKLKIMTSKATEKHTQSHATASNENEANEKCAICLDECTEPKKLDKCGHTFCSGCIDHYFTAVKPQCPCCFTIYGELRGNQPDNGKMKCRIDKRCLPGFKHNSEGTMVITYEFPNGIQDEKHPNPGMPYHGTSRIAYLPFNDEGREIFSLLQKAFNLRQVFTVGQSRTTGCENVVTWNDIHHKTSVYGGPNNFGYPDDTYLNRVRQELAAKGIQ